MGTTVLFNLIFAIASTILMVVVVLTHCRPISAYWQQFDPYLHPNKPVAYCDIAPTRPFKAALLVGLVNDFCVWLLPVFEVTVLMKRQSGREGDASTGSRGKRRIGYILLFGTGFVACAAEFVRVVIAFVTPAGDTHPEYAITKFIVSSISMYLLAVVCACVPPSAPIWVSVWRWVHRIVLGLFVRKQLDRPYSEEEAEPVTRVDESRRVGGAAERERQPKGARAGGTCHEPGTGTTTDQSGGWSWSTSRTDGLDAEHGNELMDMRSIL
ncbi:MAG: hypothetical protein M1831_000489 [Alyxoria varia]|nr:MAG: hypothetical protein M1831_000489 [Alyxoria varia]